MTEFIEKHRSGCAFAGIYTALAVKNILPYAHSGPGCLQQAKNILDHKNAAQGPVSYAEPIVPCSNFSEKEVVFGGIEKLKTGLTHAFNVYKTDMIAVFSGCVPAIVGDDLDSLNGFFSGSQTPLIYVDAPGFKGNSVWGHHQFLRSVIEQYLKDETPLVNPKQVNVWGIIPFLDPFWDGTFNAAEKLLAQTGLEPNIIYGDRDGIGAIKKIPHAAFNLVISPWWDLDTVKLLQQKFGTSYLQYPNLPIGLSETTKFLHVLGEYAGLDKSLIEDIAQKGEREYMYFLGRSLHASFEGPNLPKRFVIIANSNYALALSKHLINDLGMIPERVYITDGVSEEYRETLTKQFTCFDGGIKAEVIFTEDGGRPEQEIKTLIKEHPLIQHPYILGSYWDKIWANECMSPFLPVSIPLGDRIVLNKTYFGYAGGLTFYEDLNSVFEV
jgi:nitrogenase molybdenum-iron protein beta chain